MKVGRWHPDIVGSCRQTCATVRPREHAIQLAVIAMQQIGGGRGAAVGLLGAGGEGEPRVGVCCRHPDTVGSCRQTCATVRPREHAMQLAVIAWQQLPAPACNVASTDAWTGCCFSLEDCGLLPNISTSAAAPAMDTKVRAAICHRLRRQHCSCFRRCATSTPISSKSMVAPAVLSV